MELAAAGDDNKALRAIARNLIAQAQAKVGLAAIKEVADRLDGKATQTIGGDEENPLSVIHRIERVIKDAANTNS